MSDLLEPTSVGIILKLLLDHLRAQLWLMNSYPESKFFRVFGVLLRARENCVKTLRYTIDTCRSAFCEPGAHLLD